MVFRPVYLAIATAMLAVEVAIAQGYIPGAHVRNSLGDVLVIALIYFLLRGVTAATPMYALVVGLATGLAAELLQYIHLADMLGLKPGSFLSIVIGNTFSFSDLVMYLLGGVLAIYFDLCVLQKYLKETNSS